MQNRKFISRVERNQRRGKVDSSSWLIATLRDPSGNFLGESSPRIGRKYPTTGAVCDVCGGGRGSNLFAVEKNGRKGGGRGQDRNALPPPPLGWRRRFKVRMHTYELCIRRRLCAIVRCIIIPEKVSATIPSGADIWISVEPMEKCMGWDVQQARCRLIQRMDRCDRDLDLPRIENTFQEVAGMCVRLTRGDLKVVER